MMSLMQRFVCTAGLGLILSATSAQAAVIDFDVVPLDVPQLGPTIVFSEGDYSYWFDNSALRQTVDGVGPSDVGGTTMFLYKSNGDDFQLDQFKFYRYEISAGTSANLAMSGYTATQAGNASATNDGTGDGLGKIGSGTAAASNDFGAAYGTSSSGASYNLNTASTGGSPDVPASLTSTDFKLLEIFLGYDASQVYSLAEITVSDVTPPPAGVPEPSSYALMALCLSAGVAVKRRRKAC